MIRRKAVCLKGQPSGPDLFNGPGWVLGWILQVDANKNETMMIVWESGDDQSVSLKPIEYVKFADGQPDPIPTIV